MASRHLEAKFYGLGLGLGTCGLGLEGPGLGLGLESCVDNFGIAYPDWLSDVLRMSTSALWPYMVKGLGRGTYGLGLGLEGPGLGLGLEG